MNRNLDGVYFRVKRNGKWDNVCFSDLSETEKVDVLKNKDIDWVKSLCMILGKKIREIGDQFDIVTE